MENNNYDDDFSFNNIKHTIIYVINNYHKFLLLLLVVIIIYFVDYITYINALIYSTPQIIPGLTNLASSAHHQDKVKFVKKTSITRKNKK
jgi:hypothetical protein